MMLSDLRRKYHQRICEEIVRIKLPGKMGLKYPNFADAANSNSIKIAWGILKHLGAVVRPESEVEATSAGPLFETITADFLKEAFGLLSHLRPGEWEYSSEPISRFEQYSHLGELGSLVSELKKQSVDLSIVLDQVLGQDYIVKPDIVISRWPVADSEINSKGPIVDLSPDIASLTPLRREYHGTRMLHASISCKWTVRSDRAQNTRTEALNLIRTRKGHVPHIMAITAEPLPTRIASLALGTGDLDCVYHFALPELRAAIEETTTAEDQLEVLEGMVQNRRLRDISDLPFDLAI